MKKVINNAGVDRTQALWQYVTGQNIPAWDSGTSYLPGDTVIFDAGSPPNFDAGWYCLIANSNEPPFVGSAFWKVYDAVGTGVRDIIVKDFYFLGPPVGYPNFNVGQNLTDSNYAAYPIVDGDYPISYQPYPEIPNQAHVPLITFQPFAIEKDKLTYKTGFEGSNLTLTLRPRDPSPKTDPTHTVGPFDARGIQTNGGYSSASFSEALQVKAPYTDLYAFFTNQIYQTMRQSFGQTTDWYLAPVTMFRGFSPAGQEGDMDTFGAAVMFRGRVSDTVVDALDVKVTVSSLMQIFKQKVPSQTVQPGNRWAPFNFQSIEDYFCSRNPGVGGYNWLEVIAVPQNGAPAVTDGVMQEGWALILTTDGASTVGVYWRKVYTNSNTFTSGPNTFTTVVFLENLPQSIGDVLNVQIKVWRATDTSTNPSGPGSGFPYVPQPLTGIA